MPLLRLEPRLRIARVPMMYAVHLDPGDRREAPLAVVCVMRGLQIVRLDHMPDHLWQVP